MTRSVFLILLDLSDHIEKSLSRLSVSYIQTLFQGIEALAHEYAKNEKL